MLHSFVASPLYLLHSFFVSPFYFLHLCTCFTVLLFYLSICFTSLLASQFCYFTFPFDSPLYLLHSFVVLPLHLLYLFTFSFSHWLHSLCTCCITVDSATAALLNGACIHPCISKQMHYKTPFTHNSYMKSLEIYENYITLFCLEKSRVFDSIILTHNHAWHITQSG
jgi:hypothetical protein